MDDGTDSFDERRSNADGMRNVADLATRAIAVLASKRTLRGGPISEQLITDLTAATYARGETALEKAIADILDKGIHHHDIIDTFIPEAARRLGDAWGSDHLGFAEVSIGSARLQRSLRDLVTDPPLSSSQSNSILVAVQEGETHTLGAMVLTAQLRRYGLSVRILAGQRNSVISETVAEGQFDAIFLSSAVVERLVELGHLVENLRKVGPEEVPIAVGGAVGNLGSDVAKITKADFVVSDAREAIDLCNLTISTDGVQ